MRRITLSDIASPSRRGMSLDEVVLAADRAVQRAFEAVERSILAKSPEDREAAWREAAAAREEALRWIAPADFDDGR